MGLTANTGPYNAAAEYYGVDDPIMTKIPRMKFNFELRVKLGVENTIDPSYGQSFTFHRVQTVGLPDYNYNIVRVNQYNRTRYVPTRLETTPLTVLFYDTKDNQFQNLLLGYARHYFSQGHSMDSKVLRDNNTTTVNARTEFGVRAVPVDQRFFFDTLEIVSKDFGHNGQTRTISAHNCMITSVSGDTLSYASSEAVVWNVQFQPEHVNISSQTGQSQTASDVVPTYDVSRSAAAGMLVDKSGNPLRDSAGQTIAFTDVVRNVGNTLNETVNFVTNGNSGFRFDINGHPVTMNDLVGLVNAAGTAAPNNTLVNTIKEILPF